MKNSLYVASILFCFAISAYAAEETKLEQSPCPELFLYKTKGDKSFEADLKGGSPYMPHPLSDLVLRLVFSADVSELTATGDFKVTKEDAKTFKLENPDITIPRFKVMDLATLALKYKGDVPNLVTYSLNGVQVCPMPARSHATNGTH